MARQGHAVGGNRQQLLKISHRQPPLSQGRQRVFPPGVSSSAALGVGNKDDQGGYAENAPYRV